MRGCGWGIKRPRRGSRGNGNSQQFACTLTGLRRRVQIDVPLANAAADGEMKMKFLALYLVPASVIEDWKKTDPTTRTEAEEKMRAEWGRWMAAHASQLSDTMAGGKTKRVTASGLADVKNDIMLYSIVEADSHEAATKIFEGHPHLQIPQSSIEIMEIRPM